MYYATELTEFELSVIDAGIEVEGVARRLFNDGVLVAGSKTEAQQKTAELLASNIQTLFQPIFEKDGLLAAIDVLQFHDEIHEIKSSTRVREEHLYDLAFQVVLLRKNGLKVSRAFLVHLNASYTRQVDLELGQLFLSVE
ncbi:MAG: Dna2/Cas4 domain-containing protein [Candidatus Acidiferrales bacterium]